MRWDNGSIKERLRRRLKRLRAIKVWQLVILLLLSTIIAATLLRLNSLTMSELRKAVITADEKGDAAAINKAVSELGSYVHAHMNTGLRNGFYLTASYERAREAAVKAASDTNNPDSALYQKASVECQSASARAPYGGYYVPCVLSKVKEIGGSDTLASELKLPRSELYKIDFVSPLWSPDLAGISVAISAFILLVIIFRLTGVIFLKALIKRQYKSI